MTVSSLKQFDLNIEKVLEHWIVAHAVREVIANALDERALTKTREPVISKGVDGAWHIRDYGRGLRYEHLTQNENKEKLAHPDEMIGKFGVGLKDALATFDRHHIGVQIRSRHGDISIGTVPKHGFEDIRTLHALISEPSDPGMAGTDVILTGIKDSDIEMAKGFFLQFSGDKVLDATPNGSVLRRSGETARIYVNGLLVAEEENFLFSYNVTKLSAALRRALNRERTNVGRSAYTDRVEAILLASSAPAVADALAKELERYDYGNPHEELRWADVQRHAVQILNATEKVVFVTSQQMYANSKLVDYAQGDGYRVVVVPQALADKLPDLQDTTGLPIRNLDVYHHEWGESFSFQIVAPEDLSRDERAVYERTEELLRLLGWPRKTSMKPRDVLISETMRVDRSGNEDVGQWREEDCSIIIKRSELRNLHSYAGTLLHELAHAATGTDDRTLEFEDALTDFLGVVAAVAITH